MFDGDGKFNLADFEYKVNKLLRIQDRLVLILNILLRITLRDIHFLLKNGRSGGDSQQGA